VATRLRARHHLTIASAMLAFALVASACSSSSSNGGANNGSSTTPSTSNAKPKEGGSMTFALEAETTGGWCLPEAQLAAGGIQVARAIYDTLTVPDSKGDYIPFLAQSVTASPDYKTWTIKIRPNIKFQDGTALTGQVVKDNLDAYTGLTDSANLLLRFNFDQVKDVKLVDPMTVAVDTKIPWVSFPSHLYGYGRVGIAAEAQLKAGKNCFKKMIGTGPFAFNGDWQVNDHLTVVKNPNYWRKDKFGQQLPYLDKLTFRPVIDPSRLTSGLQTKLYDLATTDQTDVINDLSAAHSNGTINWDQDSKYPEITYAIFNTTKAPFDNINARKAYAFAVNSKEYNDIRQHGLQQKTQGPFGANVIGYVPLSGYPAGLIPPPTGDTTKAAAFAKTYQTQSGQKLAFTYTTASDSSSLQSAQLIQGYMKKAGIDMSIKQEEQSVNISDVIAGSYQVSGWRNHPGFDPDDQWVWWHCSDTQTPAANDAAETHIAEPGPPANGNNCDNLVNFSHFNDAEIDKDLTTGRENPDPAARKAAYEDLNIEFAKQYWEAWGYYSIWTIPEQTNVNGVLGPNLPTATDPNAVGNPPFPGLTSGTDVSGLWKS
jgi:peptide/nickel transport system substrate-binding protein